MLIFKMKVRNFMPKWNEEEISILRNNWEKYQDDKLKELLHDAHTRRAIKSKRNELGLYRIDMNKSFSFDNFVEECNKKDYIIISKRDDYKTTNTKLKYICKGHKDKGIQEITTNHLLSGRGCYYCGRERTEYARRNVYDESYYKEITEKHGFEYCGNIIENNHRMIKFICQNHRDKGVQLAPPSNLKRNDLYIHGCKYCDGHVTKSDEVFKQEMKRINKNILVTSIYQNQSIKVHCKCAIHKHEFDILPSNLLQGQTGCTECIHIKRVEGVKKTDDEYQKEINVLNPHITLLKYNGMTDSSLFRCNIHNKEFYMHSSSLIRRHTGCPECSGYSSEVETQSILNKYDIKYEMQKRFLDCIDKRSLPFDFYLPDYNIIIETDGEQHYRPVKFGGMSIEKARQHFKITAKHDQIKNEYCKNNNIILIRVPYWEFSNIEDYLINKIKKYIKEIA